MSEPKVEPAQTWMFTRTTTRERLFAILSVDDDNVALLDLETGVVSKCYWLGHFSDESMWRRLA